jgi:hypothetical protein
LPYPSQCFRADTAPFPQWPPACLVDSSSIQTFNFTNKVPPLATKRPSYLKRQKEQKRLTRANDKREAKRERKRAREEMAAAPEPLETVDGMDGAIAPEGSDAPDDAADAPNPPDSNDTPSTPGT